MRSNEIEEIVRRKYLQLNIDQRRAVNAIIDTWDAPDAFVFPIVEGPPGTGKTTVGVIATARVVLEQLRRDVAYLCYTHYAADKALLDLINLGFGPNRVQRVVDRGRGKLYEASEYAEYYTAFDAKEELTSEQQRHLKQRVSVLIGTIYGAHRVLEFARRPLIIVDEFSQVPPHLYFAMISRAKDANPTGYALVGDPNQLPIITTQPELRSNIGTYIMARKIDYEPHKLVTQYRMHEKICDAVNALRRALNTYPLRPADAVRQRDLTRLGYEWIEDNCPEDFREILNPREPCIIINTDNLPDFEEIGFGQSKLYRAEAILAAKLAKIIHQSFINENTNEHLKPVILSPYSAQVGFIKELLAGTPLQDRCLTIYQSQGREYPCVIVSFVRKNPHGIIGFLDLPQLRPQTYVACSRAMSKLIILLSKQTFYERGYILFDKLISSLENKIIDADPRWVEDDII